MQSPPADARAFSRPPNFKISPCERGWRIVDLNENHNSWVWWHMTSWQPYLRIFNLICAYGDRWKVSCSKVSARGLETNLINLLKISMSTQELANIISKDVFLKPNLNVDMFHYVAPVKRGMAAVKSPALQLVVACCLYCSWLLLQT